VDMGRPVVARPCVSGKGSNGEVEILKDSLEDKPPLTISRILYGRLGFDGNGRGLNPERTPLCHTRADSLNCWPTWDSDQ